MHSVIIFYVLSYSAMLKKQPIHQRYTNFGPLVLKINFLKFSKLLTDRGRTVSRRSKPSSRTTLIGEQPEPLEPSSAPGCDEPTSRCQTVSSIRALRNHQPVIPGVPFIRWAIIFLHKITGSLWPTEISAWFVYLAVKQIYAITLYNILLYLNLPLYTSVTF